MTATTPTNTNRTHLNSTQISDNLFSLHHHHFKLVQIQQTKHSHDDLLQPCFEISKRGALWGLVLPAHTHQVVQGGWTASWEGQPLPSLDLADHIIVLHPLEWFHAIHKDLPDTHTWGKAIANVMSQIKENRHEVQIHTWHYVQTPQTLCLGLEYRVQSKGSLYT